MPASNGESSKEQIYTELRHAIIMGHVKPGERLNVDELAGRYGISITPVRDALQALCENGLLTQKPRSGFFVPEITLKELRDLLEMREILELSAVARAAERITEHELAELDAVHAGYTGDDERAAERYIQENRRLHYLIGLASGNEKLAEAIGHLHDQLLRYFVFINTGEEMAAMHDRLLAALRAHDAALARQVILQEMRDTQRITLEHAIQQEGDSWQLKKTAR